MSAVLRKLFTRGDADDQLASSAAIENRMGKVISAQSKEWIRKEIGSQPDANVKSQ
jgi:hypothetical protein